MEQRETADCAAAGDEPESGTEARALAATLERAVWEALGNEHHSGVGGKASSLDNDSLCLVRPVPAVGGELRFYRGMPQPFRPHSHDFLVIGLVAEGERLLVCNGESRLIAPGDLIVFGPGDVHGCRQQGEAPFSYISITASPCFLTAAKLRGPVVRDAGAARRFAALVRRLLGVANDGEGPANALASLLECLAGAELSKLPDSSMGMTAVHDAAARRAEALLRESLLESVDLRTMAAQEGISEYALIRAYRRRYSITPIQHLISLRTERACGLLAAGELPAEAAREAGFADQAHLTRAFKQRVGTTPAAYRKMVHGKGSKEPLQ